MVAGLRFELRRLERLVRGFARVKAKVEAYKGRASVEPPPNAGK